jgi:hypothetical protein
MAKIMISTLLFVSPRGVLSIAVILAVLCQARRCEHLRQEIQAGPACPPSGAARPMTRAWHHR